MGRRHFKPEQIIHMLREAEINTTAGAKNTVACRYPRPRSSRTWNARMFA
jgi:hypothetical protein